MRSHNDIWLEEKQKSIRLKYQEVMRQEEILWFQRSRAKWLSFGDWNTHYFHGLTVVKRRKNTYEAILDLDGNWVEDVASLERLVTEYFSNLFTYDFVYYPYGVKSAFPKILDHKMVSKEN